MQDDGSCSRQAHVVPERILPPRAEVVGAGGPQGGGRRWRAADRAPANRSTALETRVDALQACNAPSPDFATAHPSPLLLCPR